MWENRVRRVKFPFPINSNVVSVYVRSTELPCFYRLRNGNFIVFNRCYTFFLQEKIAVGDSMTQPTKSYSVKIEYPIEKFLKKVP